MGRSRGAAVLLEQEATQAKNLTLLEKEKALAKKDEAQARENPALIATIRQQQQQPFWALPAELEQALCQPANVERLPTLLPHLLFASEPHAALRLLQDL